MCRLTGVGTPRNLQGRALACRFTLFGAPMDRRIGWNRLGERVLWSSWTYGKYWASRPHHYTISTSHCGKNNNPRNQGYCHRLLTSITYPVTH